MLAHLSHVARFRTNEWLICAIIWPMLVRGRYRVIEPLGSGAVGTVFEAHDEVRDQRIALKCVWHSRRGARSSLRAEFRVLASLRHPRLCRVHDFGRLPPAGVPGAPADAAGSFMSRELVRGDDLRAAARRAPGDLGRLCALVADAAAGLEVLHRAGIRHGDFKPSNAIVDTHGAVRLIDFGLSIAETSPRQSGTLAYMAPEVLRGDPVDRRADLYALGVTLYELIAGIRPSGDRTGGELFAWHAQGARPRLDDGEGPADRQALARLDREALARVDRVLARLWAAEPDGRFASAGEARAALLALARSLGQPVPPADDEALVIAPLERPAVLAAGESARRRLSGGGGPACIELVGEIGSGRTTALTELAWRAELDGAEVVWGAGTGPAGVEPLDAALRQIAGTTGRPLPPHAAGEPLASHARVARWLEEVGEQHPLLVILDDLDFAGPATTTLAGFLAHALSPRARVGLLVARRPGAAGPGGVELRLPPLETGEVAQLLSHAAERDDGPLAARIHAHTGGNLLHVVAVLEHLRVHGFRRAASLAEVAVPPVLARTAEEALGDASSGARAACEALAVLGRPASAATIAQLAPTAEVADAVARGLLVGATSGRGTDAGARWQLPAPHLAQVLYAQIDEPRRGVLHAAAARALAADVAAGPPENAALAAELLEHRVCAGQAAGVRAALAGVVVRLIEQGAHDRAVRLALRGLALVDAEAGDPAFFEIRLRAGEAARMLADVAAARALLEPVAGAASAHASRARVVLAMAVDEGGAPERAIELLAAVLDDAAGQPGDRARAARELSRIHIKRGAYDRALAVAEAALDAAPAEHRAHLEVARTFASAMLGDDAAGETLVSAAARAEVAGDDGLAAVAHSYAALVAYRRGDYELSTRHYRGSQRAAERCGDVVRMGTAGLNLGAVAFLLGDYAASHRQYRGALSALQGAGALSPAVVVRKNLAQLLVELGALEQARAELTWAMAKAEELGMRLVAAGAQALLGIVAYRTGDRGEGAQLLEAALTRFEDAGDERRAVDTLLDIAEVELEQERAGGARAGAALARAGAAAAIADSGRRARFLALEARAAAAAGDAERARRALGELAELEAEGRAPRRHVHWTLHLHAAAALTALGDADGAHRRATAALDIARAMERDVPAELAANFWHEPRRRALRRMVRRAVAAPGRPAAALARAAPGATVSSSLMDLGPGRALDELFRLLDVYRRIASETEPERLVVAAMDAAIELSGADRGFLLLAEPGATPRVAVARNLPRAAAEALRAGDAADRDDAAGEAAQSTTARYSRTIAERVLTSGEPVVTRSAQGDPRFGAAASVHALAIESVVCVPVCARGEVVGALYLETALRSAPFTDADVKLLGAFGDQVAVLLYNARLLERDRERAAELERAHGEIAALLAERTASLEQRTEELALARRDLTQLERHVGARGAFGLVGRSRAMERVYQLVERLAATDVPVLVLGESGTGKELVARALHDYGPRAHAPWVAVNCGALPAQLLESELFGHERGAFTGATQARRGLLETASGGTLLLDEVGEMPARMQTSLLRVLQEGVIRRVGGLEDIRVDVRIVAATHRDLAAMVAAGDFREDLYYRLHVVPLVVPPLRERSADVPLLVELFLERAAARTGLPPRRVNAEAMRALIAHPWPGNVRQLEHAVTNAFVLAEDTELGVGDFAVLAREAPQGASQTNRDRERERILDALARTAWNKSAAAKLLEMPRRTFYRRLAEYEIQ